MPVKRGERVGGGGGGVGKKEDKTSTVEKGVVICCLLNVLATCSSISETDLLRHFNVMPH